MTLHDPMNQDPSPGKASLAGHPREFWWLIWLVLFLVAFNLVLFAKFVVGSRSGAGTTAVESATNALPVRD
jgi:hypothetical protein